MSLCHNEALSVPSLDRILAAIHSHPRWSWAGLIAYAAAVTFPHEDVQWLATKIGGLITHRRLYAISAGITLVEAVALTWVLARRLHGQPGGRMIAGYWLLTIALIAGTWGVFTANNVELVHYPQYFPEGMALAAMTLSPAESMAWVVLFGCLDEGYQYAVLSSGRAVPFDFNDVYMDLLGGAAGMLVAMAFLQRGACDASTRNWTPVLRRPGVMVILSIAALGVLLWRLGLMLPFEDKSTPRYWFALSRFRPQAFWILVHANGPKYFHTLSPLEGPILILATIAAYMMLDRQIALAPPATVRLPKPRASSRPAASRTPGPPSISPHRRNP